MHALTQLGMLAGITWDPFIRGLLITVAAIVLLPGSIFLVLSTNVGARVGLLLAGAGLTGLMCILAILWMVLASTAAIGRPNSWAPIAVITGDFAGEITVPSAKDFPAANPSSVKPPLPPLNKKHWFWPFQSCSDSGWRIADPAKITDPQSAADKVLAPSVTPGAPAPPPVPPQLVSPFSATTDYIYVAGYEKGANSGCLLSINKHKIYLPFGRSPHLAIMVAQPVVPVKVNPLAPPPKPKPDTSKPKTYVILERNLGSVRQPQLAVAIFSGIVFLIICDVLHRRDKEIWARQAAEKEAASGAGRPREAGAEAREPVGASR